MNISAKILIALIAGIHVYIFIFEAFFWEQRGAKVFRSFPEDLFSKTKALAFNQGVYNLFLAIGLIWVFFITDPTWQKNIASFFLGCVSIAGLAGAMTERKIFLIQSLPAIMALVLVWL